MIIHSHLKGAMLTCVGILILSPDALLIRLIQTDIWTMLFWRGLLCGIIMMAIAGTLTKSNRRQKLIRLRAGEIQIIVVNASSHFLFIFAIAETTVANTLVILSISPLLGALLSLLMLRENVANRTWLTTIAVFFGLLLIFSQSVGGGTLTGDISALACALMLALNFVLLRKYRSTEMIHAVAWGNLFTAAVAWFFTTPEAITSVEWIFIAILGIGILPISSALITLGPRYLPAPEVGLILLLEAILGPLWVWLIIKESPSVQTLIGGMLILAALSWMSITLILENRKS